MFSNTLSVEVRFLNNIHLPKLIRLFSLIFNTTCNSANLFNFHLYTVRMQIECHSLTAVPVLED